VNSDVDIILEAQDLNSLEARLKNNYGTLEGFKTLHTVVDGKKTLICNFLIELIPFEVFAQDKPSMQQTAYLHLLIEERLLKIGGESFKAEIRKARAEGLKTEPAFAKALGLDGDPYQALLKLQTLSFKDLESLLS
jgi:hypothetical protein